MATLTRTHSGMRDCGVCQEECVGDDRFVMRCGHPYHTECIDQWHSVQHASGLARTCPLCRREVANEAAARILQERIIRRTRYFLVQWKPSRERRSGLATNPWRDNMARVDDVRDDPALVRCTWRNSWHREAELNGCEALVKWLHGDDRPIFLARLRKRYEDLLADIEAGRARHTTAAKARRDYQILFEGH